MSDDLDPPIDVGDVVCLASGGPSMTVSALIPGTFINSASAYLCQWFGDGDFLQEAEFPRECLRPTDGLLMQEDDDE